MRVFILAGGKGARLADYAPDLPKPMLKICGKPVLEYQLELLKKYGITQFTILIHHFGEKIVDYFGDGSKWGVKIDYFNEEKPLGTAGGIGELAENLNEDFLVFYGDVLMNLDLKRFINFHQQKKPLATLVAHPNDHPFDSDLLEVTEDSRIIKIFNKPHPADLVYRNLVSAACYVLSPKICQYIQKGQTQDFGKDIFPKALAAGEYLLAYITPEYLKDVGTVKRLKEVSLDVRNGIYDLYNLANLRPAVFLDRDGVITEETYQKELYEVKLLPKAIAAIKKLNSSKYLTIIITNQSAVAKGFCTYDDVLMFHKKLETKLGQGGAKIDGIYFCPHLPDKGYLGENPVYKVECSCRKPKIGMINKAAKDFNIDLAKSYFIGDATIDAKTAENAGVEFIGVGTGYGLIDNKFTAKAGKIFKDLNKAVDEILILRTKD